MIRVRVRIAHLISERFGPGTEVGHCSSCVTASISHAPSAMLQLANEVLIIFPVDFVRENFYRPEMRKICPNVNIVRVGLRAVFGRNVNKQTISKAKLILGQFMPSRKCILNRSHMSWRCARAPAKFCSPSKVVFEPARVPSVLQMLSHKANVFAIFFVHASYRPSLVDAAGCGPAYANIIVLHVDWFASNRLRTVMIIIIFRVIYWMLRRRTTQVHTVAAIRERDAEAHYLLFDIFFIKKQHLTFQAEIINWPRQMFVVKIRLALWARAAAHPRLYEKWFFAPLSSIWYPHVCARSGVRTFFKRVPQNRKEQQQGWLDGFIGGFAWVKDN